MAKQTEPGTATTTGVVEAKKLRNDGIDLSPFTYKGEFVGEQYEKYCELIHGEFEEDGAGREVQVKPGLDQTARYDFEGYKVTAIRKRLYPKSKVDLTVVLAGFKIVEEAPKHTTTNTLRHINILNAQLEANGGKIPMIYYLLKKA